MNTIPDYKIGITVPTGDQWSGFCASTVAINTSDVSGPVVVPRTTMQMLTEHPAFTSSVDELVNMWLVRYGADWVKCEDIDEEFYKLAYTRLKHFGRIEEFYINDTYTSVVRVLGGK